MDNVRRVHYALDVGFENGKLVRVVLSASFGGGADKHVNVLHYDLQDSVIPGNDPNDPQLLADAFRDDVVPSLAAQFDSGWTIFPVLVEEEKDPLNPTAARSAWTSGSATPGTRTGVGEILPVACTPVATLHTAHIGRRFRGRIFPIGPISEGDQSAGVLSGTALTRIHTYLDDIPLQPDIVSGVSSSQANWCVYSRTQRAANLDPYASHVTDFTLGSAVHFLRSRA